MLDSVEYVVPAKNFASFVNFVSKKVMTDCPGLEEYSDIKAVIKRIKELGTFEAVFGGEPEATSEPAPESELPVTPAESETPNPAGEETPEPPAA